MKIGTDAVLLGAWAPTREAKRILDIGTGCGIIALMLAQRTAKIHSTIGAIDIDEDAARQAVENFVASPWSERLPCRHEEVHCSVQPFSIAKADYRFDLIVCNPPFFRFPGSLSEFSRNVARHASRDERRQLFESMYRLLDVNGRLCLVLPFQQLDSILELCGSFGLCIWNRTDVRPTPNSSPKRVLLEFGTIDSGEKQVHSELIVETSRHQYSEDYANLTRDFHLRYV